MALYNMVQPMPPVAPGAVPPGPTGPPVPGPLAGPPSGPFRIGPNGQFPQWLQDKIDAFNSLHNQAVAAGGPAGLNYPGAGPGYHLTGFTPGRLTDVGSPRPPGPTGPPVQQPPNWQDYWAQWYRQRQPYADWLSGYVRGAY